MSRFVLYACGLMVGLTGGLLGCTPIVQYRGPNTSRIHGSLRVYNDSRFCSGRGPKFIFLIPAKRTLMQRLGLLRPGMVLPQRLLRHPCSRDPRQKQIYPLGWFGSTSRNRDDKVWKGSWPMVRHPKFGRMKYLGNVPTAYNIQHGKKLLCGDSIKIVNIPCGYYILHISGNYYGCVRHVRICGDEFIDVRVSNRKRCIR